jgi:hypothetical protein
MITTCATQQSQIWQKKPCLHIYAELFFEYNLQILWTMLQVQAEKLVRADSKS